MTKTVVYAYDALPIALIKDRGPVSAAFLRLRIHDFRSAGQYIRDLPYGRNAAVSDMLAVLNERKGTCSTKHALLKALAGEQALPIRLMLGIYEMNAQHARHRARAGRTPFDVHPRSALLSGPPGQTSRCHPESRRSGIGADRCLSD